MASVKWQCSKCGTTQTTQGLRPSVGGFCGKAADKKHHWSKVIEKPTKFQCTKCGTTYSSSNGLRPPVGSFCGKSTDHKHKWVKV